jgi:hypothetical protein
LCLFAGAPAHAADAPECDTGGKATKTTSYFDCTFYVSGATSYQWLGIGATSGQGTDLIRGTCSDGSETYYVRVDYVVGTSTFTSGTDLFNCGSAD